ncbi:MAG: hypothetical protein JO177_00145 [Candidatus Eremiobacteraeota bacterium]|nr:hypothetical protein [Candidatus Eremiobacteraeota bacterium]
MNLTKVNLFFEDLGGGGEFDVRSEFDPSESAIRINTRVLNKMKGDEAQRFIEHAIAHELYHVLEYCGDVERSTKRSVSEARAERFAQMVLETRA